MKANCEVRLYKLVGACTDKKLSENSVNQEQRHCVSLSSTTLCLSVLCHDSLHENEGYVTVDTRDLK